MMDGIYPTGQQASNNSRAAPVPPRWETLSCENVPFADFGCRGREMLPVNDIESQAESKPMLASSASSQLLEAFDTGQLATDDAVKLCINSMEIHLTKTKEENIISTLKHFIVSVALKDATTGSLSKSLDGTKLHSKIVFEDGSPVTDASVTGEPPLLYPEPAVLVGGKAYLRMRITVLSSLCGKRLFRILIATEARPDISAMTDPAVKTITKLHRPCRPTKGVAAAKNRDTGGKRALDTVETDLEFDLKDLACEAFAASSKSRTGCDAPCKLQGVVEDDQATDDAEDDSWGGTDSSLGSAYSARDLFADIYSAPLLGGGLFGGGIPGMRTEEGVAASQSTLSLWDEVTTNARQIAELRAQQKEILREVQALRRARQTAEA